MAMPEPEDQASTNGRATVREVYTLVELVRTEIRADLRDLGNKFENEARRIAEKADSKLQEVDTRHNIATEKVEMRVGLLEQWRSWILGGLACASGLSVTCTSLLVVWHK